MRFNKSNQLHTLSPSNDDFTEQFFFSLLNYGAHHTYSIDLNRTRRIGFLLPQRFRELLLLRRSHHHEIVMGEVFSFNLNGNQCFDLAKLCLIESHAHLHVTHVGAFLQPIMLILFSSITVLGLMSSFLQQKILIEGPIIV